jgi:hypothetical protein
LQIPPPKIIHDLAEQRCACVEYVGCDSTLAGSAGIPAGSFVRQRPRLLPRRAASRHGLSTVYRGVAVAFSLSALNSFLRFSQLTAACTELFETPTLSASS